MVFGNTGEESATGVAFTRNPATGENIRQLQKLFSCEKKTIKIALRPIGRTLF